MRVSCDICPHHCNIEEGHIGLCNARMNNKGKIVSENYGRLTALALDPIEKKPLYHYYPGSKIMSVGSYGCNLSCPFCQNCDISMSNSKRIEYFYVSPKELLAKALALIDRGNIGVAYTYNEPLIGYEFIRDCSILMKDNGLKNVVVTNGYICEKPFVELLPYVDAFNIDLKGFSDDFYHKLRGDLTTVKRTIELAAQDTHVEVTTLIVPGENDSEEEIEALTAWLAEINPEIPFHISRFFPRWKMMNKDATPVETIYHLAKVARKNLKYVYEGNC